jgi:hypothetical protein
MRKIRIGEGAGYSGAWIEPAKELAERGDLQYLTFEALAERTIALRQLERCKDSNLGHDPWLEERMKAVLEPALFRGIRIVTNMGGANPFQAGKRVLVAAREMGLSSLKVAIVEGDDVLDLIRGGGYRVLETGEPIEALTDRMISANAYLGAKPIAEALATGANVVITGRVADPALLLGCLIYEFDWSFEDWPLLGSGVLAGHLTECSAQVTGGYFADPGYKDVSHIARIGYPIAEVGEDGECLITKVPGSGGAVTELTCKEQVLYEVQDPSAYITPDVTADFSKVQCVQVGPDQVKVSGASGRKRPDQLKVSVGLRHGFIGEGQISYGGPGAVSRAQMAADIIRERLDIIGLGENDRKMDLIGVDSLFGPSTSQKIPDPWEVRLRVAVRTETHADACRVGREVEALWIMGPAGGGGATGQVKEVINVVSLLLPRDLVESRIHISVDEL